jgi:hypothetical protein
MYTLFLCIDILIFLFSFALDVLSLLNFLFLCFTTRRVCLYFYGLWHIGVFVKNWMHFMYIWSCLSRKFLDDFVVTRSECIFLSRCWYLVCWISYKLTPMHNFTVCIHTWESILYAVISHWLTSTIAFLYFFLSIFYTQTQQ